jgi:two-component system OmpR family sensor kinase
MNVEQQAVPAPQWTPPPPAPPGARRSRRRWWLPHTLTARLAAGAVALVVVIVVAIGLGTYFSLRSFLYERLDQQLQTTAASSSSITDLLNPSDQNQIGVHAPQYVWIVGLDMSGNVLLTTHGPAVQPMQLSAAQRAMLAARRSSKPLTLRTTDGVQLRVVAERGLLFPGRVPGVLVLGLSTDEVERTLDRLLNLELIIGASAVVLALVATTWGVRISLRRLRQVTATAQEVAAELSPEGAGLDRRVPMHEPGTEVGQLAESMNTLLSAVETQFAARLDSERRMRQFLADASHELRTPLTSIRGYAELARMQRALGGPDADEVTADNLDRIESEGTRMSRLVEDLLTLARGDQGQLPQVEPVDVADLLDDVVTSSRAAFPERSFAADAPPGLVVRGDHDQLLRAIRNLVTNAATHTRADGPVRVRADPSGPGVSVQVIDAGPGLPPEEAAHVFERFWRADKARTRARGGSGLGLAIVASIVQLHGGTVRFDSAPETGSTVTVWLPAGSG